MKHQRRTRVAPANERSQRQLRVGEVLRRTLFEILERGEVRDPALAGVSITVTEVRVSPDLKNATAYVIPLAGHNPAEIVIGLNRAAPFLRRRLGEEVDLRWLPSLSFEADTSFDQAARIDTLLRDAGLGGDKGGSGDGT